MKSKIFILLIFLQISVNTFSQDKKFARTILDTLCSSNYHGRGYAHDGNIIAAKFIVKQYNKLGLKYFGKSRIQKFELPVNTLPENNTVDFGNKKLVAGKDYLISASSNSIKGKYEIALLNKDVLSNENKFIKVIKADNSEKVILIDTFGLNDENFKKKYKIITHENVFNAKAVIQITDKNLMRIPSQRQDKFALITLKKEQKPQKTDSVYLNIDAKFYEKYETQNIISYIKGEVDTFVVFSAHYDHIGHMGRSAYFPGANDNASGVAMTLTLAKYFSELKQKPYYSIAFINFSGEELGLLGSKYYTENPVFPLKKIKILFNLDMVGSGDKGIQIVNGKVYRKEFDKLVEINNTKKYLPKIKIRGAAANSDHYFFYANGVKSFFIYTLGEYKEYHNIYDKSEALGLNKFTELCNLLIDFVDTLK